MDSLSTNISGIQMNAIEHTTITMAQMNEQHSLGALAVNIPGATAIFRSYKLDFCCGGQQSLAQACVDKGLDVDRVLEAIRALDQIQKLPPKPTMSELIVHILERYHAVHRQQLPELIRMARRVEAVHREHPHVPLGLAAQLETMQEELLEHMAKEEAILFPLLHSGGHPMAKQPIEIMRHEHMKHVLQLEQLAKLTTQHQAPQGACNTWQALYAGTARLADDLVEHIHLENNYLFVGFENASPTAH
jgi:regulator of cell morphogenesis and NO signaling